jgi:transcriptional regulator with XRE-family HTH domain
VNIKSDNPEKDPHRVAFGQCLRRLRGARSREWLAEQIDLDVQQVGRLERGEAPVELRLVAAVAEALKCGVRPLIASVQSANAFAAEEHRWLVGSAAYEQVQSTAEALDRRMKALDSGFSQMRVQLEKLTSGFLRAEAGDSLAPPE